MLFTRIALCLKDIFLNVLGMGNNSENSCSREKMHCTIIPERLGVDELGEERGEGEEEASHPELGVSSILYLRVCVFIYMWVYKTMKGLNFYKSRQRVNQRKLFWIQNLRHDYGLNRIWNRR